MALQLYVDDSGKNDPPVFVLAGLIASAEAWVEFSKEWSDALLHSPTLEHFKMKDANRCLGAFKGFSHDERDKRLRKLAEIIKKYVDFGVSVAIPHNIYKKIFYKKIMEMFDTPYTVAFYLLQVAVHKYLRARENHEKIDLIFDRQLDRERELLAAHDVIFGGMPNEVSTRFPDPPVFMDDKQVFPLQAADLLAWHIRRSWRDGREKLPHLSAAGPILQNVLLINEIWLEKDLEHLFGIGMSKIISMNTLPPYSANFLRENFDSLATAANIEVMEKARPFVPIEMVSFPAIGMEKYLFVRNCSACDNPHLHKRLGNRCLAEQTAIEWPFASR